MRSNNDNTIKIPKDVKEFAKSNYSNYKKKMKKKGYSKDEIKDLYYMYLLDYLPKTIIFMIKYGYINRPEIRELKTRVYKQLSDEKFVKILTKNIKNGDTPNGIELLPILIKEILEDTNRTNAELLKNDPNAETYDVSDLIELSELIMKKKMKKLKKAGVSRGLAFDVLSTIPCEDALKSSQQYRIRMLYDVLYEHSKGENVSFEKIMKVVIDNDDDLDKFIVFALLERKEKFSRLTEAQKVLYIDITSWCLDMMEHEYSKERLRNVLYAYIKNRQRDEANNKDSNRRYILSTLSPTDYKFISGVINSMIAKDENVKKYL